MKNLNLKFTLLLVITVFSLISCKTTVKEEAARPTKTVNKSSNDTIQLEDIDGDYTTMDELLAQYKGKVVYVDYWASWCRPCRAMMPASRKLKERFKGEEVVFLYISIDTKRNLWERAHQDEGLSNYSFLATNYPKAKLFQQRNVNSIPRYMLYDKNGRMIDDNAMRPVQPDLERTIAGLISM